MELPNWPLNVSNVLITRQLQKTNCNVNFGEHEIAFMLECVRELGHSPSLKDASCIEIFVLTPRLQESTRKTYGQLLNPRISSPETNIPGADCEPALEHLGNVSRLFPDIAESNQYS